MYRRTRPQQTCPEAQWAQICFALVLKNLGSGTRLPLGGKIPIHSALQLCEELEEDLGWYVLGPTFVPDLLFRAEIHLQLALDLILKEENELCIIGGAITTVLESQTKLACYFVSMGGFYLQCCH